MLPVKQQKINYVTVPNAHWLPLFDQKYSKNTNIVNYCIITMKIYFFILNVLSNVIGKAEFSASLL